MAIIYHWTISREICARFSIPLPSPQSSILLQRPVPPLMQNKKSVKSQLVLASEIGALLPVCRVTNLLIKQFDDIFLYDIIEWWIWEVHSASKHISQGLLPLTRNRRKFILEISDFGFSTEWIHIFIQGVILHYYKPSIALQWSVIYKKVFHGYK